MCTTERQDISNSGTVATWLAIFSARDVDFCVKKVALSLSMFVRQYRGGAKGMNHHKIVPQRGYGKSHIQITLLTPLPDSQTMS